MTDAKLLSQFCESRNEEVFRALVERHAGTVYAACLRGLGGDAASAEDACQSVFVVLAQNAEKIRNREALAGWLFGTAGRVTAYMRRQEARRRVREEKAVRMKREQAPAVSDTSALEGVREHLNDAVISLRPKLREAVVRYFLQG